MRSRRATAKRPPFEPAQLEELALAYVGRFATTRARLRAYLARKLRERGWAGTTPPDLDAIAERCTRLGYVNDQAFALSKSRSLSARGYGPRRVREALRAAGVEEGDAEAARELAGAEAVNAALRFAQRRRIGPFASEAPDHKERERALAAMVRAGHAFSLARAIADLAPGRDVDLEELAQLTRILDR